MTVAYSATRFDNVLISGPHDSGKSMHALKEKVILAAQTLRQTFQIR
jgi:hypothetical protein